MNLPMSINDLSSYTQNSSQAQARQMMNDAMAMAGTYLKGMKGMAGGQPGVPMKTMAREQMDQENLNNYYSSQGLVAPISSTDPSAEIRKLGQMYMATTDPSLRSMYHQQALSLAQKAGWIQPGQNVESVNSLPQMTNAGLPNAALMQQAIENAQKDTQLGISGTNSTKSGGSGGGGKVDKNSIYADIYDVYKDKVLALDDNGNIIYKLTGENGLEREIRSMFGTEMKKAGLSIDNLIDDLWKLRYQKSKKEYLSDNE